jgi:hypothetical protein
VEDRVDDDALDLHDLADVALRLLLSQKLLPGRLP